MDTQIRLLEDVYNVLPETVFTDHICRRIHERQMNSIIHELMNVVEKRSYRMCVVESDILQVAYQYNLHNHYDEIRYNLIYYDMLLYWADDDWKTCSEFVSNWSYIEDDYFNIYPDLPLLIGETESDEFDY